MSELAELYSELTEEAAEEEDVASKGEMPIGEPFDVRKVSIFSRTVIVGQLVRRIKSKALNLTPGFQRSAGIWTKGAKSRLIESLLVKIPIPSLFFDASDDEQWLVIDGLQRLSTIDDFVNDRFRLAGLEFLRNLEGLTYSQLPACYQMRIDETEINCHQVMPGTPLRIKYDIFKRINTGGVPLSQQEIRHALNLGPCTDVLEAMVGLDSFSRVINGRISPLRMADRECALRYLAFCDKTPDAYARNDLNMFLCDYMAHFNEAHKGEALENPALQGIVERFSSTMELAGCLFGDNAFQLPADDRSQSIKRVNKALFEAWTVNLAQLDNTGRNILKERKDELHRAFLEKFSTDGEFSKSVTRATGGVAAVHTRFHVIKSIIQGVVHA